MSTGNSGDLPATEDFSAPRRQLINNIRDQIVPDIECRPASASLRSKMSWEVGGSFIASYI